MSFSVHFTPEAVKDTKKLTPKQRKKLKEIILLQLMENPFVGKKLTGNLTGFYSIRLNIHDRIVYNIDKQKKMVTILKTKTHYGE